MGMSASQARLIQLTARMSDLELEGQQINQQRLNLANQSSAIQEEALKMPVPTAPSTYDFMRDIYSGTDKDGNEIYVGTDDNGKMFASVPVDDQPTLKATQDTKTNEPVYEKPSEPSAAAEGRTVKAYYYATDDNKDTSFTQTTGISKDTYESMKNRTILGGKFEVESYNTTTVVDEYNADGSIKSSHEEEDKESPKTYKITNSGAEPAMVLKEGKTERYTKQTNPTPIDVGKESGWPIEGKDANGQTISGYFVEGGKEVSQSDFVKNYCSGYSQGQIESMKGKYFADDKGAEIKFDNYGNLTNPKDPSNLHVKSETKSNIGGNKAYSIDAAKAEFGEDAVKDIVERINNFENTKHASGADTNAQKADLDNWRIYKDAQDNLCAAKVSDDGKSARLYGNDTDKIYQRQYPEDSDLKLNTDGEPTSVKVNGKNVTIKKGKELDTDAYKAAEAKYTNEKAEYDHAQEEVNTQVKKLQTIDKQLELKLKRLDTERNALNTEIDAVKKVIQDNTDKSFKTFSG